MPVSSQDFNDEGVETAEQQAPPIEGQSEASPKTLPSSRRKLCFSI